MVEVFITDIQNKVQAERASRSIQDDGIDLKINFDLNETNLLFPCGHTILRVESNKINVDKIRTAVNNRGFKCEILEDIICE